MTVRHAGAFLAFFMICLGLWARPAMASPPSWPLFNAYVERFISPDGRVIDHTGGGVTTSEGQSYALFFALVMDDRPLFDRLLHWTENNLARGALDRHLPSTRWGHRPDGTWGVIDPNSAADSDLWIGYVLLQAGRLWDDRALTRLGYAVLYNVVQKEVVTLPALGPMLLPAPYGFVHDRDTWRLNPSYLPLQLLSGLESAGVPGPWRRLRQNTLRLLRARSGQGFIEDWIGYHRTRGFITDPVSGPVGSYDAIRTYLWAGLLADRDRSKRQVTAWLGGPYRYWKAYGQVPEHVDCRRPAQPAQPGPVGFLAILLPRLAATGDKAALRRLETQIELSRSGELYGDPPAYYDQNLLLFAKGFVEGRYRFDAAGSLVPRW